MEPGNVSTVMLKKGGRSSVEARQLFCFAAIDKVPEASDKAIPPRGYEVYVQCVG